MTQLIIGGVALPKTSNDKYRCYPQQLAEQVEMISGRMVTELRGPVQVIEYGYDYMQPETYTALLSALRAAPPIRVTYLPDDGGAMITSDFVCTKAPMPTFAFAMDDKPYWHDVSFVLREIKPHD